MADERTAASDGSALRIGLAGCQAGLSGLEPLDALDALAVAERAGLDGIWVNEEHLARSSARRTCWATLPFLALVAGRTRRMRLGTAALLLPLHHPLRLAEELGTIASLAPGRLAVGIAPSRPGPYADAFGAPTRDFDADFRACHAALRALLRGETIDVATEHHRGRDVSSAIVPERMPAFFRAAYRDSSIAWAAEQRMPLLQHFIQSPASLRRGRRTYRAHAGADADRLLAASPVDRFVAIADDDATAERQAVRQARELTAILRDVGIQRRLGITEDEALEPERFVRETAIVGSPTTVRARLAELAADHGTGTVNLNLDWFGTAEPAAIRRGLELITGELVGRVQGPRPAA